jgi:hypothetical protein
LDIQENSGEERDLKPAFTLCLADYGFIAAGFFSGLLSAAESGVKGVAALYAPIILRTQFF